MSSRSEHLVIYLIISPATMQIKRAADRGQRGEAVRAIAEAVRRSYGTRRRDKAPDIWYEPRLVDAEADMIIAIG
jgi:Flp pilus assembly protein TadD